MAYSDLGYGQGYYEVDSTGGVYAFGNAAYEGSMYSSGYTPLSAGHYAVGIAVTPDAKGYWIVAEDGGVFAFGDAAFYGSEGSAGLTSGRLITGMASTPDGKGYWLVGQDGAVYAFGDATFEGSMGTNPLQAGHYAEGIVTTPAGTGYILVGQDGGTFSFGTTNGCTGLVAAGITVSNIVGIVDDQSGNSCVWIVGNTGAVYAMAGGNNVTTPFWGSMGADTLAEPVVGAAATPDGAGYWLVAQDGGVFTFGEAAYLGSMAGSPLGNGATIVGIAAADWAP